MNNLNRSQQLFSLADEVVETILQMNEDEVLTELASEGISLEEAGKKYNDIVESALKEAEKQTSEHNSVAVIQSGKDLLNNLKLTGDLARQILNDLINQGNKQLTFAAQNKKTSEFSDQEAINYVTDLVQEFNYEIPQKFLNNRK